MAGEITVNGSLAINKGNLSYQSLPTSFVADMDGTPDGPTPGAITATTAGVDVDLSELASFGVCRIQNLDSTNYVDVGIRDPETVKFYPLMRLLAGESYPIRLSPDLQEEYGTGAGTGTTGADTNRLHIKANTASCNVIVDAFPA